MREDFPTWEEVKKSIILRQYRLPRFEVYDRDLRCWRTCLIHRVSPLPGTGVLLWLKPEFPTKPEISWIENGQVHTMNVEVFGPFAVMRRGGDYNAPLIFPRGFRPQNEAGWLEIKRLTAKACGARYEWRDSATGHIKFGG